MYHHVCQGEGEVGQAEEQQHRVVVQPAEDRDVGEDDPHLAELGHATSSELARSSAKDVG
jgi:hypothetical protein